MIYLILIFGSFRNVILEVFTQVALGPCLLDFLEKFGPFHQFAVVDLCLHFFDILACQFVVHSLFLLL